MALDDRLLLIHSPFLYAYPVSYGGSTFPGLDKPDELPFSPTLLLQSSDTISEICTVDLGAVYVKSSMIIRLFHENNFVSKTHVPKVIHEQDLSVDFQVQCMGLEVPQKVTLNDLSQGRRNHVLLLLSTAPPHHDIHLVINAKAFFMSFISSSDSSLWTWRTGGRVSDSIAKAPANETGGLPGWEGLGYATFEAGGLQPLRVGHTAKARDVDFQKSNLHKIITDQHTHTQI
ncbi:hypothetical protein OSB04_006124 [Centaurea solstitialis]|uniref:Uncharacterized protein n=1 Tax=Centaurea solstitialis TaxID=347529 RepID=A0AA38TJ28_9ASTR|nr:hypothetical protein OSB04_006124 [Centaurea solstitialis]